MYEKELRVHATTRGNRAVKGYLYRAEYGKKDNIVFVDRRGSSRFNPDHGS